MAEPLLVSTSDIAELVGERLPVVSTWRSRFKEGDNAFPEPAGGTPSRPLFDLASVQEWIARNRPRELGPILPVQLWASIRELANFGPEQYDVTCWIHALLYARKVELAGGRLSVVLSPRDLESLESVRLEVLPADAVAGVKTRVAAASSDELIAVSDFILHRIGAGYGRAGGEIGAVDSNVSEILAAASRAFIRTLPPTPIVYDGACGIGQTIIAFERSRASKAGARVIATEINDRVAALASVRFALRDIEADVRIGDALAEWNFGHVDPDLVLSEPPFGVSWAGVWQSDDPRGRFGVPPVRGADLAWVVDAAARIKGSAQAIVVTTMGALFRGGAEERVRASLVRSGAVETIIALPPNILQYTSLPLAVWVLKAPGEEDFNRTVSVVDASSPKLDDPSAAKRAEWVRTNIASWVIDPLGADHAEGIATAIVHLDELQDAGMDLTPTRWGAHPDNSGVLETLWNLNMLFSSELKEFQPDQPLFDELEPAQHVVTVREMTSSGDAREAKLWTGRGLSNEEAPDDTITSQDVRGGVIRAAEPSAEPGFVTQPGDVIFTTMGRVRALVDSTGGHRLGNGVHALRLEQPSRFTPEYVAMCLAGRWNDRHQKGSAMKTVKPGDLEIPLLPLRDQGDWVHAFTSLSTARSRAASLVELADDLLAAAQNALRFGTKEDR